MVIMIPGFIFVRHRRWLDILILQFLWERCMNYRLGYLFLAPPMMKEGSSNSLMHTSRHRRRELLRNSFQRLLKSSHSFFTIMIAVRSFNFAYIYLNNSHGAAIE